MTIKIKPLSVNKLFQGRRYRTKEYDKYEKDVIEQLTPIDIPDGELTLKMIVGFSNKLADIDNIGKGLIDILQKFYGFNDNRIYRIEMTKTIVKKGNEFINFEILKYTL